MFSQFERFTRELDLAKRRTIAGEIGTIIHGEGLVDLANADLYRSPEISALCDKWLLSPTPPCRITYNVPMSPELKRAYAQPTDNPDPASYVQ